MLRKINLMILSLVLCAASVWAQETAPSFSLVDTNGKTHNLSDYAGKYVVLEWTNYECPFVKKHYNSGNMQSLQKEFTAQGVTWLSVNSSAPGKQGNFSADVWNQMIQEKGTASSAVLLDPDGSVGKAYGAKTTPHIFVVNPQGALIYQGAIDSVPSADPADIAGAKNYVRAALTESMAGQAVTEPKTQSYGCSVKY